PPPALASTLSLHDALPISDPAESGGSAPRDRPRPTLVLPTSRDCGLFAPAATGSASPGSTAATSRRHDPARGPRTVPRSGSRLEIGEHTSELQSPCNIVCR